MTAPPDPLDVLAELRLIAAGNPLLEPALTRAGDVIAAQQAALIDVARTLVATRLVEGVIGGPPQ